MGLCPDAPVKLSNGYVEKAEVKTRSTTSGDCFHSETSLCHVPEANPDACRQNMKFHRIWLHSGQGFRTLSRRALSMWRRCRWTFPMCSGRW